MQSLEGEHDALRLQIHVNSAEVLADLGRLGQSRRIVQEVVADWPSVVPSGAEEDFVAAVLLLVHLREGEGKTDEDLDLLERVIREFGAPTGPNFPLIKALALSTSAAVVGLDRGDLDGAVKRYEEVEQLLQDASDPELQRLLAKAMTWKGYYRYLQGRTTEANAICRSVVARFGGTAQPGIADVVNWAQELLEWALHCERPESRFRSLTKRLLGRPLPSRPDGRV
jgi:ATP/maltotriose-dependent transcriptional regulator MalT